MRKKAAREARFKRNTKTLVYIWAKKGLRSKRVSKFKLLVTSSSIEQAAVNESLLLYTHIESNDFVHRGHKQLVDDDVPVCSCKVVKGDSESACGDHCLNVLTSNECTPGFCLCGELCNNQRFQQRKYIKTKLVKTGERGWGLLADQDVKAGEFVIEYCGEVISCDEARTRSQTYELEGLQDAYIISLSGSEFIDATRKGSLGRFINHSCDPNCETRKWTVLGEVRVGIFAKEDIKAGTELTYNYNFEWYGGAKVRCRCGAASCVGFLGAKSRGFQEDTYVWDDNDDRFSVENVPLYDSEDDEPLSTFFKRAQVGNKSTKPAGPENAGDMAAAPDAGVEDNTEPDFPGSSVKTEPSYVDIKKEKDVDDDYSEDMKVALEQQSEETHLPLEKEEPGLAEMSEEKPFKTERAQDRDGRKRKSSMASPLDMRKRSLTEKLGLSHKKSRMYSSPYLNSVVASQVKAQDVCYLLSSKEACEELVAADEAEAVAASELAALHDQLRPAMEDLGKDAPDNLPISVAEEWITLTCKRMAAVFNFNHLAIKSLCGLTHKLTGVSEQT